MRKAAAEIVSTVRRRKKLVFEGCCWLAKLGHKFAWNFH